DSGNSRNRKLACGLASPPTGRGNLPPDDERSGIPACRSLTAQGSSTRRECRHRCQAGRRTRTPPTHPAPELRETPGPDKGNTGGRFAESKETIVRRDMSSSVRLRCTKADPPKKPCNT